MTANILQVTGAVAISFGIGLIFVPAGIITGGIFAVLIGISLEKR